MPKTITATKAKAEFLALIDAVANGTSGPVTVTKHGKARVMIVPTGHDVLDAVPVSKGYGALKGRAIALHGYDYEEPVLDDEPGADAENLPV